MSPHRRIPPLSFAVLGAVFLVLLAAPAGGDPELERMAKELAKLRSELDLIESDLQAERTRSMAELRSLESRRAALDGQLDAERLRQSTAAERLAASKEALGARREQDQVLLPVLERHLDGLREAIEQGLPFRQRERLAALEELRTGLRTERIDPATGAARLWHFVEDELKLADEVVRTKVPISLGGDEGADAEHRLVDAVRIGMVTLFVREQEGFSQLRRGANGTWQLESITDAAQRSEIARLFDNLGKQIIEADYVLPLPPLTSL